MRVSGMAPALPKPPKDRHPGCDRAPAAILVYMSTHKVSLISPEQYLEFDRKSEIRNEYIYGEIVPILDATAAHCLILANAVVAFSKRLAGAPCQVYAGGPRLCLDGGRVYAYADLTVVCGRLEYTDLDDDTVTDPKVIVEVLSPSNRSYDLGLKRRMYSRLASLQEMLFIEQERMWIEHWRRLSNGHWEVEENDDGAAMIRLESLNCEIPIAEFYSGIELTWRENR